MLSSASRWLTQMVIFVMHSFFVVLLSAFCCLFGYHTRTQMRLKRLFANAINGGTVDTFSFVELVVHTQKVGINTASKITYWLNIKLNLWIFTWKVYTHMHAHTLRSTQLDCAPNANKHRYTHARAFSVIAFGNSFNLRFVEMIVFANASSHTCSETNTPRICIRKASIHTDMYVCRHRIQWLET